MLTLSWALFAVNTAIQFPLLIRFGYTRVSVLGTTLPLAAVAATVYKLHLSTASIQRWLPLLGAAGVAALMMSAAVARTADRRRLRYGRPNCASIRRFPSRAGACRQRCARRLAGEHPASGDRPPHVWQGGKSGEGAGDADLSMAVLRHRGRR
jgi:hypothetical protein